jgi:hypothetical protein
MGGRRKRARGGHRFMKLKRESVLFIGTQFSILYTSMYSPAEAATHEAKKKGGKITLSFTSPEKEKYFFDVYDVNMGKIKKKLC